MWLLPFVATRTVVTDLPEAVSRSSGAATRRPMRVTWFTESPRLWTEAVCFFVVVVVVLLRIAAPPVVWIDATVESGPTAARNRSSRNGFSLLGLAADRQRSATGEACFPYGVRRRST